MANTTYFDIVEEYCTNISKPDLGLYFVESGFVVEIIIIILSVYLSAAFIMHGKKRKMLVSKSKKDMHRGLVYKFALVTVFVPFLRYAATLSFIFSGRQCNGMLCELSADVGYILLMCSITATYSFLWVRQRVFYGHPSLCDRYGRCLVYFSKFSIVPIILASVVAVAVAVYPEEYTAKYWQCYPITHQSDPKVLIYAALMVLIQSLLLGLFLHPVLSHMKVQRRICTNGGSQHEPSYSLDSSYTESTRSKYTVRTGHRPSDDCEHSLSDKNNESSCMESTEFTKDCSEIVGAEISSEIHSPEEESAEKDKAIRKPRSKSAPDLYRTAVNRRLVLARSTTHIRTDVIDPPRKKSRVKSTWKSTKDALKNKVRKTRSTVRSRGRVMKLIKRTVYLCLTCILSDFLVSVINTIGWDAIHQAMQFVVYDISLMINVVTVIASFENFRRILALPLRCCLTEKSKN